MDPITQSMIQGAAGAGGGDLYVDDVFHIQTHIGTGVTRTINNGIDLAGEGGLIWARTRDKTFDHTLFDTVRSNGRTHYLSSNDQNTPTLYNGNGINSFNNNGYTLGDDAVWGGVNYDGTYGTYEHVLTTFRKAPNFFDIVSYTGNGNSSRNIAHNLGSIPGFIVVKRLDSSSSWMCYHRQMNLTGYSYLPANYYLQLNSNAAWQNVSNVWNQTMPTAEHFTVGDNAGVNANNGNYIAYIFAHNDGNGGFGGNSGTDGDIIQCSRYAGNGTTNKKVSLGWEPQYVLIKNIGNSGGGSTWLWYDQMRTAGRSGMFLNEIRVDENSLEQDGAGYDSEPIITFDSDGFTLRSNSAYSNYNGHDYMYVAIRRSDGYVGRPPEAGTDVFAFATGQSGNSQPNYPGGIVVDYQLTRDIDSANNWFTGARLIGNEYLITNNANTKSASSTWVYDYMNGYNQGSSGSDWRSWQWKRHAGFDVVTYDANQQVRQVPHSLGKIPEMMWIKSRNNSFNWKVYHKGANGGTNPEQYYFRLNHTDAETASSTMWNNTAPTSTAFTIGTAGGVNSNGINYVAMLFASVDNISKVGFWVGDGTNNRQITTGFQPRFLMVFLSNQGGGYDWQVMDSNRGFIHPNNNILKLNTNAAQSSQPTYFTPTSTGFTITESAFNGSSQNWIYYAHA